MNLYRLCRILRVFKDACLLGDEPSKNVYQKIWYITASSCLVKPIMPHKGSGHFPVCSSLGTRGSPVESSHLKGMVLFQLVCGSTEDPEAMVK